jgi:CHAD domain-containing protein
MSVRTTETEIKYETPDGAALPALAELPFGELPGVRSVSDPVEMQLSAEYYDTADLRLIRAGVTLRRRTGGTDDGWHLKLPDKVGTRQEIRLPAGDGTAVPGELAGLVRGISRGAPLLPTARLDTTRKTVDLLGDGGGSLAEVAADEVRAQALLAGGTTTQDPAAAGESAIITRWAELEVELKDGDQRLLDSAAGLLRGCGLVPSGRSAKLERALAVRLPPAAEPRQPAAGSPAADVVLGYLREQATRLLALDPMVRIDEPDAVHQMRVTARRMRATLRTFKRVLDPVGTGHLAAELRWLGQTLGEARDAEVLAGHLTASAGEVPVEVLIGPVQARIQRHFAAVRARARAAVLTALDGQRYFALLDEIDRLLADPPLADQDGTAGQVLPGEIRRAYKKVRRRLRRARGAAAGQRSDLALHQARKAAKRARYAAEAASQVCGKPANRLAKRMKRLQSELGEHHDAVVARQVIRDLGIEAHLAGENAFTFGLLYERENARAEQARTRAAKAARRAKRRRYRRWLG